MILLIYDIAIIAIIAIAIIAIIAIAITITITIIIIIIIINRFTVEEVRKTGMEGRKRNITG